jgi:hypothetical protein
MRDSEIEQRILLEIQTGKGMDATEVCVFSIDGIVTLKGTVRTRQNKTAIQQAAYRAEAVIAVINQLRVAPSVVRRSRSLTRRAWRGSNAFLQPPLRKIAAKNAPRA